jgi:hypothetical protein
MIVSAVFPDPARQHGQQTNWTTSAWVEGYRCPLTGSTFLGLPPCTGREVRCRRKLPTFDAMKGVYVREHTDLTWPSDPDFRLQFGAPPGRMRHRDALGSIAYQRHLDRRSRRCPDGRARYFYRIYICVLDTPPVPEGAAGGTKLTFLPCLRSLLLTLSSDVIRPDLRFRGISHGKCLSLAA